MDATDDLPDRSDRDWHLGRAILHWLLEQLVEANRFVTIASRSDLLRQLNPELQ